MVSQLVRGSRSSRRHAAQLRRQRAATPPPTISVTPDTGLGQGQSVTVTGANFAPLVRRSRRVPDRLEYDQLLLVRRRRHPHRRERLLHQQFAVRRGVPDFGSYPPNVVDCASVAGVLLESPRCRTRPGPRRSADRLRPLAADPGPGRVRHPAVRPSRPLRWSMCTAQGFAPGEPVVVSQCDRGRADYPSPRPRPAVRFSRTARRRQGVVDTSLRVHRELTSNGGVIIIADSRRTAPTRRRVRAPRAVDRRPRS